MSTSSGLRNPSVRVARCAYGISTIGALPARPAIVNLIGGFFAGFCQFQILFFGGRVFCGFSEFSILRCLLSIIVRVVHTMRLVRLSDPGSSLSRYYGGAGACRRGNIEVAPCRSAHGLSPSLTGTLTDPVRMLMTCTSRPGCIIRRGDAL